MLPQVAHCVNTVFKGLLHHIMFLFIMSLTGELVQQPVMNCIVLITEVISFIIF